MLIILIIRKEKGSMSSQMYTHYMNSMILVRFMFCFFFVAFLCFKATKYALFIFKMTFLRINNYRYKQYSFIRTVFSKKSDFFKSDFIFRNVILLYSCFNSPYMPHKKRKTYLVKRKTPCTKTSFFFRRFFFFFYLKKS